MSITKAIARAAYWALVNLGRRRRYPGARFEPSVQWRGRFDAQVGEGAYIGPRSVLSGAAGAEIDIGEQVWIGADAELSALGRVEVGAHSSLQHRTQLHGDVRIGAGFIGAAGLYVSSGWHEFRTAPALPIRVQDRRKAQDGQMPRSRPVSIGEDCWLGINVAVMPGVRIGRGCVVGANSVVTRDLAPYSIAVGAPARVIGQRLDFAPPVLLDGALDEHVPYFYEGFRQIAAGDAALALRRRRGGFAAEHRFGLACAAPRGVTVTLQLDALAPLRLRHGAQAVAVAAGASSLAFEAAPDDDGVLRFAWSQESSTVLPDQLVVLGANASLPEQSSL